MPTTNLQMYTCHFQLVDINLFQPNHMVKTILLRPNFQPNRLLEIILFLFRPSYKPNHLLEIIFLKLSYKHNYLLEIFLFRPSFKPNHLLDIIFFNPS
ncbi:hypothetical protein LXL04_007469 [Taraxacum kok-saghyz]